MKTVELKCVQSFYETGQIESEKFYQANGNRHNETGPAWRSWHENGQLATELFFLNGKYHNETGPAYRGWHENGQLSTELFCLNGKRHSENGPAARHWREDGQIEFELFYLNGKELTREEFARRTSSCSGKIVEIDGKKYQLTEIK